MQLLVVLRARQRREAEEFQDIDRQFLLDDLDVARDRFRRVGREAEDIAGISNDAMAPPRSSISRYSQILFCRFLVPISDSGLMFSSPMKTKVQPARSAFSTKCGMR